MASATAVRPVVSALVAARAPLVVPSLAKAKFPADAPWAVRTPPLTEAQLLAKYPHMIPGTLRRDPVANKNAVDIRCACGAVRIVYTSDLFHVRACRACKASGK
jgi:hypothetical protein